MTSGSIPLHTMGCAVVAATVLGCVGTVPGTPIHLPATEHPQLRPTQRGHGALASFELHEGHALSRPTPKTPTTRQLPSRMPQSRGQEAPRRPPSLTTTSANNPVPTSPTHLRDADEENDPQRPP